MPYFAVLKSSRHLYSQLRPPMDKHSTRLGTRSSIQQLLRRTHSSNLRTDSHLLMRDNRRGMERHHLRTVRGVGLSWVLMVCPC